MKSFKILLALFMIVHNVSSSDVEVDINVAQNVNVRCGNSGSEDCDGEHSESEVSESEDSESEDISRPRPCPPPYERIPGVGCIYLCMHNVTWREGLAKCLELYTPGTYYVARRVRDFLKLVAHYRENPPPGGSDIWVGVMVSKWLNGRNVASEEWIPWGPTEWPCGFIDASTADGHEPTYYLNMDDCENNGRHTLCQYPINLWP